MLHRKRCSVRLVWGVACALAAVVGAGGANAAPDGGYGCAFRRLPARIVEGQSFAVEVDYRTPGPAALLHCELKNLSHVVLSSQTARVAGQGRRRLVLTGPEHAVAPEVLLALWLGEHWQRPLGPVAQTGAIKVITREEERRLARMRDDAAATLKRLGYRRSGGGRVAILDDELPGVDRGAAAALAEALRRKGRGVTRLDTAAVCNPYVLTRANFDLLILSDCRVFPAAGVESLDAFLRAGGHLAALGGPAFSRLVWDVGGRWVDREGVLRALTESPGHRVLLDFEEGDPAAWERGSNNPASPASVVFDAPGEDGRGRAAHFTIADFTNWDTFASPPLRDPFPEGHTLTCFAARGDDRTTQLAVEWQETDGSRWIAVVPLTREWRRIAIPPTAFQYWPDSPATGRGGPGDHFQPARARRLTFGLALTHTPSVPGGRHEFFVDRVGTAPMPQGLTGAAEALDGGAALPVIEGVSPAYKLYPVTGLRGVRTDPRQVLWQAEGLPGPSSALAIHPRPQGTGFGKERRWRWIPLLEALNGDGKPGGAAAALVINGSEPYSGSVCLSLPVTDPAYLRRPEVVDGVAGLVARILDGVFLYEGGSRYYAYQDGEEVDLGAAVVHRGRRDAVVEVLLSVRPADGGAPVFERSFRVRMRPGQRRTVEARWSPGRFPSAAFTARTELKRGGRAVDVLEHSLSVWRPASAPAFVTTGGGNFWLRGRPWYPHGVNYMPSSGIGIEDQEYFEYWLDPQPYDPDVIERDLADAEAMGLNMVSVFIYYRSVASHNLLDLLLRCRRHDLKVNLSLRPGTPMDFRWDEMREIIVRHNLAQEDTVFAYDLAWEPSFGGYAARKAWDAEWERWVVGRYGSVEAAEKAWGMPIPRADGRVTGPSDEQVGCEGPWLPLAAAYRRFVDDLLHAKYGEARRLVRSVDPNHLVSFRMSMAGDPTCGQEWMPYDFKGLAGAVDIMCPEGYGRIGGWEQVKPGWFTTAYARCVAPETPVMWAEFGYSVWDTTRMQPSEQALQFQAQFYNDFYTMAFRSGANGTVAWWFPGGYRYNERSDYGILNPDRTWRPVTHVIREWADRMKTPRQLPRPEVWIPVERDRHSDGIRGLYAEVKEAFWKAVEEGRTPGLRWRQGEGK